MASPKVNPPNTTSPNVIAPATYPPYVVHPTVGSLTVVSPTMAFPNGTSDTDAAGNLPEPTGAEVTNHCLRSMATLSGDALNLQRLLSFFDPTAVHESLLTGVTVATLPLAYKFLSDEMKFLNAKDILLKLRLIGHVDYTTISVWVLAQRFICEDLPARDLAQMISITTRILLLGFPNTMGSDVGHQFATWKHCDLRIPHVMNLINKVNFLKIELSDPQDFVDLILHCCWYLYERERYTQAREMVEVALAHFPDKASLPYASAMDLRGLVYLDIGYLDAALDDFNVAMAIRQRFLSPDHALIAWSLNNLGLAYTEINDLSQAQEFHTQAINLRLSIDSDRIGQSYSNMASTLLRLGKPDEAEEMIFNRPVLKDLNTDFFLDTKSSRFSGETILLSQIRRRQGYLDEALRLATKALSIRQKVFGNTLKTCAAMCLVTDLLHQKGKIATARSLLYECTNVAKSIPDGSGYLAKAYYNLGLLHVLDGDVQGAQEHLTAARAIRDTLTGKSTPIEEEEGSFDKLVPWMLW